jgi:hypothetical protein
VAEPEERLRSLIKDLSKKHNHAGAGDGGGEGTRGLLPDSQAAVADDLDAFLSVFGETEEHTLVCSERTTSNLSSPPASEVLHPLPPPAPAAAPAAATLEAILASLDALTSQVALLREEVCGMAVMQRKSAGQTRGNEKIYFKNANRG